MVDDSEVRDNSANSNQEKLKYALWACLGKLVDDTSLGCGSNATPQFIGALMHMVWGQIEGTGKEIETFARHAGRNQIEVRDVLMLARRHPELLGVLRQYSQPSTS